MQDEVTNHVLGRSRYNKNIVEFFAGETVRYENYQAGQNGYVIYASGIGSLSKCLSDC